jgi:hypothetical protein
MKSIKFMLALLAICLTACIFATAISPVAAFGLSAASSLIKSGCNYATMSGINQEAWTDILVQQFRETEDAGFLAEISDESRWVTATKGGNQIIHLTDIGADPEVIINNTTYPIGYSVQTDTDIPINLDKYQTKATKVTDDEVQYISYDKVGIVTEKHQKAIMSTKHSKAIHAIGPNANSAQTPIIVTTGTDDGTGRKKMILKDLISLKRKFDTQKIPLMGRVIVLASDHYSDLLEEADGKPIFAGGSIAENQAGLLAMRLHGFKVYTYVDQPYYNPTTLIKRAFGSVPAPADRQASIAFYAENCFKADGSTQIYTDPKNTQTQEQAFNIRHYYIVLPKKNRAIGAIVSANI